MYSVGEVRNAVEEWDALKERIDTNRYGLRHMVRRLDIHRAYCNALSDKQREVILMHGMAGIGQDTVAVMLGIDQANVHRRYMRGLRAMVSYLNGGTTE